MTIAHGEVDLLIASAVVILTLEQAESGSEHGHHDQQGGDEQGNSGGQGCPGTALFPSGHFRRDIMVFEGTGQARAALIARFQCTQKAAGRGRILRATLFRAAVGLAISWLIAHE